MDVMDLGMCQILNTQEIQIYCNGFTFLDQDSHDRKDLC